MKSDEFNNVKVNNEKSNIDAEFTNAQKTEYSFQSENSTTLNDELNNNKTVNDDPEANTLKSHEEEERKEKKEIEKQAENLSSSTSTAASTASGVAGTVGGIAATAATAAIVAIGAVVGIELIQDPTENKDLITFISSEVGLDTIDFSFSMPASLLSYEESPTGDMGRKEVVALIENSQGFNERYYISEYEYLDDYTLVYFASLGGLQRDTDYALTVQLEEVIYTEQIEEIKYTDLAFRTFTTLSWSQKILFHPLDVTYNSVNFEFEVALADIGVDPLNPEMPNLFAIIFDNDQYRQSLTLTQYSMIDNEHALVYDSFTGLTPETYYTIDVYQDDETNLLGSASFTTYERTSSVVFEDVYASRDYVNFTFTVDKSDIDYDPTVTPAVRFDLRSSDGTFSEQSWAEMFEEVDDNTVRSSGSFTGITPNLEYILEINLSRESEFILLGDTTFDTMSGFRFQKQPDADPSSTSTNITISIKSSYIGYISEEETPHAVDKLSIEVGKIGCSDTLVYPFNQVSFTSGEYAVIPSGDIDGLEPNTDYQLSVYYRYENENELLGSAEFKTDPDPYGFYFHTVTPSENSCEFAFDLSATEAASDEVYLAVVYDSNGISSELTRVKVTEFEQSQSDPSAQTGTVTVDGLPADANLTAVVFREPTGASSTTYGTKTFTTGTSSYSFAISGISLDVTTASIGFSINPDSFTESLGELVASISLEYRAASGSSSFETASPEAFQQTTPGTASSSFELSDLNPGEYYYGIVYYQSDSKIPLGIFDFTTMQEPPEVNDVLTNWEVVQDLNGNYRMPIQIVHDGSTDDYGDYFFVNLYVPGVSTPIQAFVPVSNDYDYALFTDNTIAQYLSNLTQMSYTITCSKTQQVSLYSGDNVTPYDVATTGTSNSIYAWKDPNPNVYNGSEVTFSFGIVAALFDKSYSLTIIFTSGATTRQFSGVSLSDYNYVSNLTIDLLRPDGYAINYETCKSTFGNKSFTVQITYSRDGTTSDTITVAEGFMFNFMD